MAGRKRLYHARQGIMRCIHKPEEGRFTVAVFGCLVTLEGSTMCRKCTQEYLNANSTVCNECHRPIFPGQNVGLAGNEGDYPFVHSKERCNPREKPVRYGKWWGNSPHLPWLTNFNGSIPHLA